MNVLTEPAGVHDKRGNPFIVWHVKGSSQAQLVAVLESMGADLLVLRDGTIPGKPGQYRARFTAYAGDKCISDQLQGVDMRNLKLVARGLDKFPGKAKDGARA